MPLPDWIPPEEEQNYPELNPENLAMNRGVVADFLPDAAEPAATPPDPAPDATDAPRLENLNQTAPLYPQDFYTGEVNETGEGKACGQEPEATGDEPKPEAKNKGGRPKKS